MLSIILKSKANPYSVRARYKVRYNVYLSQVVCIRPDWFGFSLLHALNNYFPLEVPAFPYQVFSLSLWCNLFPLLIFLFLLLTSQFSDCCFRWKDLSGRERVKVGFWNSLLPLLLSFFCLWIASSLILWFHISNTAKILKQQGDSINYLRNLSTILMNNSDIYQQLLSREWAGIEPFVNLKPIINKNQAVYFYNYLIVNVGTDGFEPSTLCL